MRKINVTSGKLQRATYIKRCVQEMVAASHEFELWSWSVVMKLIKLIYLCMQ